MLSAAAGAALVAAAAAILVPGPAVAWSRGLPGHGGPVRARGAVRRESELPWPLIVLVVAAGVVALVGPLGMVAVGLGTVLVAVVRRVARSWRVGRDRAARQRAVLDVCDGLSAELHGGIPAATALQRALAVRDEWGPAGRAAELGGDTAATLRLHAVDLGAEGLAQVAAAWEVGADAGAAMADVVDRVADGLRADADARAEVQASLGPPRATAKMLAVLPLLGIGLGHAMGASPTTFLLGSPVGWACLAGGLALAGVGVAWVERIARAVER